MSRSISMTMAGSKRQLCAWICVAGLLCAPGAVSANEVGDAANEGGLGVAAALASLIYGPFKVVYSLGGTAVAGCAWIFSAGDSEVATTVLTRAVRGTYVITPAALRGEEEIEFIGRLPEYRASQDPSTVDVAAPPDSSEDLYGW